MHRCLVDPAAWSGGEVRLSGPARHHLVNVLRAAAGEEVSVFDGRGREAVARLVDACSDPALLHVVTSGVQAAPRLSVVLLQAIPKAPRMDLIVEKAVELGAAVIVPIASERTVVRLSPEQREPRRQRWQRIAQSAAEQCRTPWVPEVRPVCDVAGALRTTGPFALLLVGALTPCARPLRDVLRERPLAHVSGAVGLLIGPEGDLTPDEMGQALAAGAVPVTFGARVLRVETAALFGLSALSYELGQEPVQPGNGS